MNQQTELANIIWRFFPTADDGEVLSLEAAIAVLAHLKEADDNEPKRVGVLALVRKVART